MDRWFAGIGLGAVDPHPVCIVPLRSGATSFPYHVARWRRSRSQSPLCDGQGVKTIVPGNHLEITDKGGGAIRQVFDFLDISNPVVQYCSV